MRSCFLLGLSLFLMGCTSETPVTTAPGTGGGAAAVVDDSPLSVALQAVNDGSAVLIDVRGDDEWKSGHFEKAVHIPVNKIQDSAAEATADLDKSKTIYTHCAKGGRAGRAAKALKDLGFKVEALETTYDAIKEAGFTEASN